MDLEFFMKSLFFSLAVLLLFTPLAHAGDHSVVGVVTCIGPGVIEVATDSGETRVVALEPDTTYTKWILDKSLAQDPDVDAGFLRVGERVRIELSYREPTVARKVWIVIADRADG
jgi:hypothetical protein